MNIAILALAAAATVNFDSDIGRMRPELHSSGFGPQICSCPQESIDAVKSMGFIVTDYRSGVDEIRVEVKGIPSESEVWAWAHDNERDFERCPLRMLGNRLLIRKSDRNSAAFSVWF